MARRQTTFATHQLRVGLRSTTLSHLHLICGTMGSLSRQLREVVRLALACTYSQQKSQRTRLSDLSLDENDRKRLVRDKQAGI